MKHTVATAHVGVVSKVVVASSSAITFCSLCLFCLQNGSLSIIIKSHLIGTSGGMLLYLAPCFPKSCQSKHESFPHWISRDSSSMYTESMTCEILTVLSIHLLKIVLLGIQTKQLHNIQDVKTKTHFYHFSQKRKNKNPHGMCSMSRSIEYGHMFIS